MNLIRKVGVILMGLVAVLWIVVCVFDYFSDTSTVLLVLRIACTIAWVIGFFVQLIKYQKHGKEQEGKRAKPVHDTGDTYKTQE